MRPLRLVFMCGLLCIPGETFAPPKRPIISGLAFVRLNVTNIEPSRRFYENLVKLSMGSSWCFRSDATCYILNPIQELEILPGNTPKNSNAIDAIGFWVGDVRQMQIYLSSRGVKSRKIISNSSAEE